MRRTLIALVALALPALAGTFAPGVNFSIQSFTDLHETLPALSLTPKEQAATQAVEICLRGRWDRGHTIESLDAAPSFAQLRMTPGPVRVLLGPRELLQVAMPETVVNYSLAAFDGVLDNAGPSGRSFDLPFPLPMPAARVVIDDPLLVAQLVNGAQLEVELEVQTEIFGPGNYVAAFHSEIRLDGMIVPLMRGLPAP